MADFDAQGAQAKQNDIIRRARIINDTIYRDVIEYYAGRRPATGEEAAENLRGLKKYVGRAYDDIRSLMNELE